MRRLFVFIALLAFSGCSFKTMVHPYPFQYNGNPDEAADRFEIQKTGDYALLDPDTTIRLPVSYANGSLYINTGILSEPSWSKKDSFSNPLNNQRYEISAFARYDEEVNAYEFILNVTESGSDSVVAHIEGLVDDATVFYSQHTFRFEALEFWEPEIRKVKGTEGTEWHHYPYGGSWSLSINNIIVGEIIQGSPVVSRRGIKSNYGISYTFLFLGPVDRALKTELINAFIAYQALVDMEYYYYECDPDNPQNESCPGSIIIR